MTRAGESLADLVEVMQRLLGPDGCPWDREQTLATLEPYLLEETYEVLEALAAGDPRAHCEELGDLLMQIVFQAELRAGAGAFTIDDVVRGIADKLVRRHPHVFGDRKLETSAQVLAQWTALKEKEKPRRALDGVPAAMPALARAARLGERAAQVGFDWPDAAGARAKLGEELGELDRAIGRGRRGRAARHDGSLRAPLRPRRGPPARRGPRAPGGDARRDGRAVGRGETRRTCARDRKIGKPCRPARDAGLRASATAFRTRYPQNLWIFSPRRALSAPRTVS